MNRTLVIVRHAKSDRDAPWPDDFSRPLSLRGTHDAVRLAPDVFSMVPEVSLMLSSPSVRALSTATIFCHAGRKSHELIQLEPGLYLAPSESILSVLTQVDDRHRCVLVFGHEPGLSELVSRLQPQSLHALPTCGAVGISIDVASWADVSRASGQRLFFITPKERA